MKGHRDVGVKDVSRMDTMETGYSSPQACHIATDATAPLTSEQRDSDTNPTTTPYLPRIHFSGQEFFCGFGAASVNVVTTFPLNKLMFRQQLYGISTRDALRQLSKEGKFHLYRGMLPPMIQKTACLSVMFGMYDGYQRVIVNCVPDAPMVLNKSIAAVLAGCTEAILLPLERIQVLLQDRHYHKHFRNTAHAFRELRQYGLGEYYRGLTPVLIRNGPSNALFFLLRGEIKKSLPAADNSTREMVNNFASGGILGASISTLFFPINVVKTRMQSRVGGEFLTFRRAFLIVYNERDRNLRQMFRGVHINYTRSLLSWGVINASYELLKDWMYPKLID